MATTVDVKDASGATVTVARAATTGSTAGADSIPVALSTEDAAAVTALSGKLPATLGPKAKAAALAVNLSTDEPLLALLPASIGTKAAASSLAVALATEDVARQGSITETAPASDTASSGLNGRMQRLAQRITSLIALLPAALGVTTKAASLSVALASDDNLVALVTAPSTGAQSSVAAATSSTTLLAANAARKGAYIYNDSSSILYILLANATATSAVQTRPLAAAEAMNILPGGYTGIVKGIWVSATGNARVTEWS